MRYGWNTLLTIVCCGVLAACASNNSATATDANQGGRDLFAHSEQKPPAAMKDAHTLQAYHWQLEAIRGADQAWYDTGKAALRAPVQLTFHSDSASVSVTGLCNTVNAGYEIVGSTIAMKSGIRTMMACADSRLMDLENRLADALVHVKTWQLSGTAAAPQLELRFVNDSAWTFKGVPTDATRYGGPAEQIFLEIAPRTRSCNDGLRTRECLEVRRVEFDDGGLRKGAGPWELFYDQIEGFAHNPQERTILRINRYERKNPPADASRYVYVLDMRVSTEIAR